MKTLLTVLTTVFLTALIFNIVITSKYGRLAELVKVESQNQISDRYFKTIGDPETDGENCAFVYIVYGEKECY